MENPRNLSTNSIGFCLLPSELIHRILLNLLIPEILCLKSLNKSLSDLISDQHFVRYYNSRSKSTTWLFVYKKRWHRDAVLHGFSNQSDRWFKLQIVNLLKPLISPGESIYFLTASGDVFLFSSNTRKAVIAVNLSAKTVKRIPPSPLGPRGTSSWRRSGMKLVSGSNSFRFLFAELVENRPVLFVYTSETDKWLSMEARENFAGLPRGFQREDDYIFLNVVNGPYESVVMMAGFESDDAPVVVRPRFEGGGDDEQQLTVGYSWGNVIDRLYVHGDGHMLIIKSNGVGDADTGARMLNGIELWALGSSGGQWERNSKVPSRIMEEIMKPYRVIMGCLERRDGVIRAVLLSNCEVLWDIIWLSYDINRCYWTLIPVPNCNMKGLNMAGIAFSSGLTL
ncbi:hypothetical protein P3X46_031513 [Hevea brasiliensis]|uniref:F-box domain-containing protein n=1 Tax=Hevea brasiliensis TaxID=3981 RepID=A0ABQ9KNH6_HEVBR|nr:uncharacterized protein LOC110639559 [Hevea brasiliensis]KAJ9140923.1 hypothetical protein P3X46_031513 [Hevea brasiliensis]